MIKKGSKVVINRPLKVTEVTEGPDMTTVTVSVTYTNVFGQSMKDELVLPRKWVSEYKPPKAKKVPVTKEKKFELVHENSVFGDTVDPLESYELSNYKTEKPIDTLKVGEKTLVEDDNDDWDCSDEARMASNFYIKRVA